MSSCRELEQALRCSKDWSEMVTDSLPYFIISLPTNEKLAYEAAHQHQLTTENKCSLLPSGVTQDIYTFRTLPKLRTLTNVLRRLA